MVSYQIKTLAKKYVPGFIVGALKGIRHRYYTMKGFNHAVAQKGEADFWRQFVRSDENFRKLVESDSWKKDERFDYPLYTHSRMRYFFRNPESYEEFCKKNRETRCFEIGSGAVGDLVMMPWVKERIVIDPLLDVYRKTQLDSFGKTLFNEDIQSYSQEAEVFIPFLENSISGFIFCTNTLDHCADPWLVLENISRYAQPGCMLLLWTDLWHLEGLNAEHRNITKDRDMFERRLLDLGFQIERSFSDVRQDSSTIEYGCVAVKTSA